jgi:hypothetical protein
MAEVNTKHADKCRYRDELFLSTSGFKGQKILLEEYYKCTLPKEEKCPRRVNVSFEIFNVDGVCPDKKKI